MIKRLMWAAGLALLLLVAACGGSGGSDDGGGSSTGGETTGGATTGGDTTGGDTTGGDTTGGDTTGGDTTGGDTTGGDTTGGDTTGGETGTETSCQSGFSPEKAAADVADGTENCAPLAGTICPVDADANLLQRDPIACDGVEYAEYTASTSDYTSTYYAIKASTTTSYDAIYVGLHYLLANKGAFTNIVRFQELAKARHVLVLVPQAPSLTPGVQTSRWPSGTALDKGQVDPTITWLNQVVTDARSNYNIDSSVPIYVSGLSNGATMAYLYGCTYKQVKAVLAVSSEITENSMTGRCTSSHPLGSVIVHGTNDTTTPYNGVALLTTVSIPDIHTHFNSIDGCTATDDNVQMLNYVDDMTVTIDYTPADTCTYRNFLVTIDGGGHNWPGSDRETNVGQLVFGSHTANFDATLEGYDLLRLAAGDE
ncbi:alpha/beta hydrolase family esterase [Solimonas marina]|uniref:alpha/beta hydrolase family esterase n=1 Tax=Solimonas marina TaxID=2714601 RepID=UPI0019D30E27|nr:PHB depolymerase family esterase [Solimonas marina]